MRNLHHFYPWSNQILKEGSLRDVLTGSKPQQTYLKKYSAVGKHKSLQLNDIRSIGWQILKALEFLHSKGLPHGNLHLGNIFLTSGQAVLSGLHNFIGGLSGKMRALAIQAKVIRMITKLSKSSPFISDPQLSLWHGCLQFWPPAVWALLRGGEQGALCVRHPSSSARDDQ